MEKRFCYKKWKISEWSQIFVKKNQQWYDAKTRNLDDRVPQSSFREGNPFTGWLQAETKKVHRDIRHIQLGYVFR